MFFIGSVLLIIWKSFSARNYLKDFPLHYHDQLCITLVQEGLECTLIGDRPSHTPKGSISVTAPNQVHANPNLNGGSYSFVTYYLTEDLVRYFDPNIDFSFRHCSVDHPLLFSQLSTWITRDSENADNQKELADILVHLLSICQRTDENVGSKQLESERCGSTCWSP